MLPTIAITLSLLLLSGCFKILDKSELSSGEMELAMLTIADRMMVRYLKRLKEARIEHVIDPSHNHGDLNVSVGQFSAYGQKKRIQVGWKQVQADSVQVLRCMKRDLEKMETIFQHDQAKCPDIFRTDFAKLTQDKEANKCGYIECKFVRGRVIDGIMLIDKETKNKATYHYYVRPCYDNYMLVAHGKSNSQNACGTQQVQALGKP